MAAGALSATRASVVVRRGAAHRCLFYLIIACFLRSTTVVGWVGTGRFRFGLRRCQRVSSSACRRCWLDDPAVVSRIDFTPLPTDPGMGAGRGSAACFRPGTALAGSPSRARPVQGAGVRSGTNRILGRLQDTGSPTAATAPHPTLAATNRRPAPHPVPRPVHRQPYPNRRHHRGTAAHSVAEERPSPRATNHHTPAVQSCSGAVTRSGSPVPSPLSKSEYATRRNF